MGAMRRLRTPELVGDLDPVVLARWLFILVWAFSAANALHYLNRGWLPHDVGTLGQPAVRVLRGQWPQRDFDDTYTGGLALFDALGFRILGISAMTLRWLVFTVYLAWVPTVWYLTRRLAGPVLAALATLLAAAWTLPMYAEGMPSWYNLFLATFGAAALFRWIEVRRGRWLFLAGLAGGLSLLVKVIGLYYIAGVLLYLLFDALSPPVTGDEGRGRGVHRGFAIAAALVLAAIVVALVARAMGAEGTVRFAVPAVAPSLALVGWAAWRARGRPTAPWSRLVGTVALFGAGIALPVTVFLVPYAAVGALGDVYRGVFVRPAHRLSSAHWVGRWGHGIGAGLAACTVLWLFRPPRRRNLLGTVASAAVGLLLAGALVASSRSRVYLALWQMLWWLPPWIALAAGVRVLATKAPEERDRKLFAIVAIWGMISLVEIPFAAPIYYFFSAPLIAVVAVALAGDGPRVRRAWLLAVGTLVLGFTVLRLNPGFVLNLGYRPEHGRENVVLDLTMAGGLRVDSADAHDYETLVRMVDALADGPYIYATPDCPEVYFLTGKRNPTPTLYEFLDPRQNEASRILPELDSTGVRVVVINRNPYFSDPVSPRLVAGLQKRYPLARSVGRFLVVWKAPPGSPAHASPVGGRAGTPPVKARHAP